MTTYCIKAENGWYYLKTIRPLGGGPLESWWVLACDIDAHYQPRMFQSASTAHKELRHMRKMGRNRTGARVVTWRQP